MEGRAATAGGEQLSHESSERANNYLPFESYEWEKINKATDADTRSAEKLNAPGP